MKKIFYLFLFFIILAGVTSCKKNTEELTDLQISVNEAIEDFISIQLPVYKDDNTVKYDYNIILAIKTLENEGYDIKLENYLSKNDMQNYYLENYENYNYTYYSSYLASNVIDSSGILKSTYYSTLYDIDNTNLKNILLDINATQLSMYDYYNIYTALEILNVNSELKTDIGNLISNINSESYLDADTASLFLKSISKSNISTTVFMNTITQYTGVSGIYYSDWETQEAVYNACSTATAINALLAYGISEQVNTLMTCLLLYLNNGGFVDSTNSVDIYFSTPQGFSALVTYKYASLLNGAYNIYD